MTRSAAAVVLVLLSCLVLMTGAQAVEELPDYWLAIAVGGAELDAAAGTLPPTTLPNPMAIVAPGGTVQLRAKIVGNRRAYMMWPETYANIGEHTVINERGFDRMSFTVNTGTFNGTGVWTVDEESYTWDMGGKGIVSPLLTGATGENINWTAPVEVGYYPITASGRLKLKYARQATGGAVEKGEESGQLSATFIVQVSATAPTTPVPTTPVPTTPVPTTPVPTTPVPTTPVPTTPVPTTPVPTTPVPTTPVPTTPVPTTPVPTTPVPTTPVPTTPVPTTPAPTAPAWPTGPATVASDAPVIVSPLSGAGVLPRAEVYGTGPAGAMIVVYTEVRAQNDDSLLKNVPGLRHKIKEDGSWHVAIPIPKLPANVAEPLYYVIKAYWATPTHKSQEAAVRVHRQ